MKYGYRVVIHKDVPQELIDIAKDECRSFVELATNGPHPHNSKQQCPSYGTGYYPSFYRRRVFGHMFHEKLTFRRLSTRRRIFGVVPIDLLFLRDGSRPRTDGCYCSCCRGGQIVKMKPYIDEDYILYAEIGDIKG